MALTANIGITKLVEGQERAHVSVNDALDVLDKAIAGRLVLDLTGLTDKTLTGGESTAHILHVTATTANAWVVIQKAAKTWVVINDGTHNVTFQTAGQASPPTLAAGAIKHLVCDGTDIRVVA